VLAHHGNGNLVHGIHIEGSTHMPLEIASEGVGQCPLVDGVAIRPLARREPSMKVGMDQGQSVHDDVWAATPVQGRHQAVRDEPRTVGREGHHLTAGVDSGVGSSGHVKLDLVTQNGTEGGSEFPGHGYHACIGSEAPKRRAPISQPQTDVVARRHETQGNFL